MRRIVLTILALVGLAASGHAETQTYFGFHIGVTNAPPPPSIAFRTQPQAVTVAQTKVVIVDDDAFGWDMFRYGGSWYLYSNGFWYRAASYRGPFRCVDVRVVPTVVLRIPPERWRNHPHGGPPGQTKRGAHVAEARGAGKGPKGR
jgi:hypothetical protein